MVVLRVLVVVVWFGRLFDENGFKLMSGGLTGGEIRLRLHRLGITQFSVWLDDM